MEAGLFTRTANSSNRAAGCREAYSACLCGVTSRGWSQAGRSPDPFPAHLELQAWTTNVAAARSPSRCLRGDVQTETAATR